MTAFALKFAASTIKSVAGLSNFVKINAHDICTCMCTCTYVPVRTYVTLCYMMYSMGDAITCT